MDVAALLALLAMASCKEKATTEPKPEMKRDAAAPSMPTREELVADLVARGPMPKVGRLMVDIGADRVELTYLSGPGIRSQVRDLGTERRDPPSRVGGRRSDRRRVHRSAVSCGILLGADAGLRAGEMRALMWCDVNQLTREITVSRSLDRTNVLTETKGWERRVVPISDRLWTGPQGAR